MEGKDHARIHTGRNDRNGRPRGSRRRTSIFRNAPPPTQADDWQAAIIASGEATLVALRLARAQAEAGHESLDGVHPRDEG